MVDISNVSSLFAKVISSLFFRLIFWLHMIYSDCGNTFLYSKTKNRTIGLRLFSFLFPRKERNPFSLHTSAYGFIHSILTFWDIQVKYFINYHLWIVAFHGHLDSLLSRLNYALSIEKETFHK